MDPAPPDVLTSLLRRVGAYEGHGINHEDEPFFAELDVRPLQNEQGVTMKFRAIGVDGTVYHDERTWVARDPAGQVGLWSLHSNAAGVRVHRQRHGGVVGGAEHTWVFGFGDPLDRRQFRQEVAIDVWPDGDLSYRVAWGLPGGDHTPRTVARLAPRTEG